MYIDEVGYMTNDNELNGMVVINSQVNNNNSHWENYCTLIIWQ
jgi:hypothetical protein